MKMIGLIGGMSCESSAEYDRILTPWFLRQWTRGSYAVDAAT